MCLMVIFVLNLGLIVKFLEGGVNLVRLMFVIVCLYFFVVGKWLRIVESIISGVEFSSDLFFFLVELVIIWFWKRCVDVVIIVLLGLVFFWLFIYRLYLGCFR